MSPLFTSLRPVLVALLCLGVSCRSAPGHANAPVALDTLVLGNETSERGHSLTQVATEVVAGGLEEPARRLLALDPVSHNSGSLSFLLKVDPNAQNYVTVKLWGSDAGIEAGRLLLYLDGDQLGYRREGDHDVLNQCDADPIFPGRWLYQTVALPRARTEGKKFVSLSIRGLGRTWPYGTTFEQLQRAFTGPSRGIYRVYSHTTTRFAPDASERQGSAPTIGRRPGGPGEELIELQRKTVNTRLSALLDGKAGTLADLKQAQGRIVLLAEAYHTPWTVAHGDDRVIATLVKVGDSYLRPGVIGSSWSAAGPLGEALARLGPSPALDAALTEELDLPADFPVIDSPKAAAVPAKTESVRLTRRAAWSKLLCASRDWKRTTGRRSYTNQSMIVDFGIYAANRGVQAIDPERAMPEAEALRYLHESAGILPWLGNDTPDGRGDRRYGSDYRLVSRKGLSRELGFVASYGETILTFTRDMAELSGDPRLREQLLKLQAARMPFRYPGIDKDGYRTMKLTSEIDNRTAHFPIENATYGITNVREAWWMELPAFLKDPVSVGAVQRCLEDNQYFQRIEERIRDPDTLGMLRNVQAYEVVKTLPPSSWRLPMSEGQPDFVFSDEENAVVALKHGDTRLFLNFYFRQEYAVSGVVRILELRPEAMRIATVLANTEVDASGRTWSRPDYVEFARSGGFAPPGEGLRQAWRGEVLPVAKLPEGAHEPAPGKWGPFVGKASFYWLRHGDFLIGLNTTESRTFTLPVPADLSSARDLVSGRTLTTSGGVPVGPLSTVVLYVGKEAPSAAPRPHSKLEQR